MFARAVFCFSNSFIKYHLNIRIVPSDDSSSLLIAVSELVISEACNLSRGKRVPCCASACHMPTPTRPHCKWARDRWEASSALCPSNVFPTAPHISRQFYPRAASTWISRAARLRQIDNYMQGKNMEQTWNGERLKSIQWWNMEHGTLFKVFSVSEPIKH